MVPPCKSMYPMVIVNLNMEEKLLVHHLKMESVGKHPFFS